MITVNLQKTIYLGMYSTTLKEAVKNMTIEIAAVPFYFTSDNTFEIVRIFRHCLRFNYALKVLQKIKTLSTL